MSTLGLALVGIATLIGVVGVVVPGLPGGLMVVGAVLVWAGVEQGAGAWLTFAIATSFVAASQVVRYVVPGRRMRDAGVPISTLALGAVLGVIGFFVVPVIGLFLGFMLGVYLAERRRAGSTGDARSSTMLALKAVGLSVLIELAGVMLAAVTWLTAELFFV